MHDPLTHVFSIRYPWPMPETPHDAACKIAGYAVRRYHAPIVEVWHRDPCCVYGADDSCRQGNIAHREGVPTDPIVDDAEAYTRRHEHYDLVMKKTSLISRIVPWRFHFWHYRLRIVPLLNLRRRLFDRCADCGKAFGWNESGMATNAREGGWFTSAKGIRHHKCHDARNDKIRDMCHELHVAFQATGYGFETGFKLEMALQRAGALLGTGYYEHEIVENFDHVVRWYKAKLEAQHAEIERLEGEVRALGGHRKNHAALTAAAVALAKVESLPKVNTVRPIDVAKMLAMPKATTERVEEARAVLSGEKDPISAEEREKLTVDVEVPSVDVSIETARISSTKEP